MNEEEKAAKLRARQEKAASKKRGKGITLLITDKDTLTAESVNVYKVIATENAGLRTIADVKEYMVDNDIVGVVYPVRMGKAVERQVQTVAKFV